MARAQTPAQSATGCWQFGVRSSGWLCIGIRYFRAIFASDFPPPEDAETDASSGTYFWCGVIASGNMARWWYGHLEAVIIVYSVCVHHSQGLCLQMHKHVFEVADGQEVTARSKRECIASLLCEMKCVHNAPVGEGNVRTRY